MGTGALALGPSPTAFPGLQQGAALEVEQLSLESKTKRDAGATGKCLACYASMLAPTILSYILPISL